MARRNQPYLPLYVQDYLTDEKLNMCSAAAQGVYIKIMCVLHKSEPYGTILLRQKERQNENICRDFAVKLARLLPFTEHEIHDALTELIAENVLTIDEDIMFQKRMVRDASLSDKRSLAGKQGAEKTNQKPIKFAAAKVSANAESENDIEHDNDTKEKRGVGKRDVNIAFDAFWGAYDKKVGNKSACEGKWNKLKDLERQAIMEYIPKYIKARPDKQYRKNPDAFLNGRIWENEIVPSKTTSSNDYHY